MYPITATLVILGLAIIGFATGKIPAGIVAGGVTVALFATGVLTANEALIGFGDPTTLFIATLFIVSDALDRTGVTTWAAGRVTGIAGTRRGRIIIVVALLVAVLTAFISVNGSVVALVPTVVLVSMRAGIAPSKLLVPLAFCAHAGSLLALTGTPVNILIANAAATSAGRPFGFFEFALVGAPLLAITVAVIVAFGDRLLPTRAAEDFAPVDPTAQASVLRQSYGMTASGGALFTADLGVVEVMIPPRSPLIGRHAYAGMAIPSQNLVILAVRFAAGASPDDDPSNARPDDARCALAPGDSMLIEGPWDCLERYTASDDVVAVISPASLRRGVPLGRGAKRAIVILGLMVIALVTGVVPPAVIGFVAVGALVLTRVLTLNDAFRAVQWNTVVLVAGMTPLGTAFVKTGAARMIADGLLSAVGHTNPYLALLAMCVLTVVLGQVISNVATVLVVLPVGLSMASALAVSPLPFLMALTVAGAAAFLTPIATPANLMVYEPGGYRFGDYWRLGLPLAALWIAVAVGYVPLIWPF